MNRYSVALLAALCLTTASTSFAGEEKFKYRKGSFSDFQQMVIRAQQLWGKAKIALDMDYRKKCEFDVNLTGDRGVAISLRHKLLNNTISVAEGDQTKYRVAESEEENKKETVKAVELFDEKDQHLGTFTIAELVFDNGETFAEIEINPSKRNAGAEKVTCRLGF